MRKYNVLFVCGHNAGRSQMATAFFNQLVDPELAHGTSAGLEPAARVHPIVVEARVRRAVPVDPKRSSRGLGAARPARPADRTCPRDP